MDKTITTSMLIVVSMIMVLTLFNVAYPAIIEGSAAIANVSDRTVERLRSQVRIIHGASELDGSGVWNDTYTIGEFEVFVWVKNVGDTRIMALEQLDVFFGAEGNFARIPHQNQANGVYPYWTDTLENATEWTPTATLRITIHYQFPLTSGRYFTRVSLPNGVTVNDFIGL